MSKIGKLGFMLLMAVVVGLSFGCAGVMSPAAGAIWMDVKGPIQAGNKVGAKEGRACASSIAGLIATGDASIATAAANGGITNIDSVDHHSTTKVIFSEFCTIVRGS